MGLRVPRSQRVLQMVGGWAQSYSYQGFVLVQRPLADCKSAEAKLSPRKNVGSRVQIRTVFPSK